MATFLIPQTNLYCIPSTLHFPIFISKRQTFVWMWVTGEHLFGRIFVSRETFEREVLRPYLSPACSYSMTENETKV